MFRRNKSIYWLVGLVILVLGSVIVHDVRSADGPVITSMAPNIGPVGRSVQIKGTGFTGSNTVDWGFGGVKGIFATGAPSSQTITLSLLALCPEGEVCSATPTQGYVDVTVTNVNGTSNAVKFLVAPHNSTCYKVDDWDDPGLILPIECMNPACNAGACVVAPSPTPTPKPTVTLTPTPTPTPSVTNDDDDDEGDVGSKSKSGSGSSANSATVGTKARVSGVTTKGPSAADRRAADFIVNNQVVIVVDGFYRQVYGRQPSFCASHFWKGRARSDKATRSKLLGAMRWQAGRGKDPAYRSCTQGLVSGASTRPGIGVFKASGQALVADINRTFRRANNGQNPTGAQNNYWQTRLKDKRTLGELLGAMQWHAEARTGY